MPSGSPAPRRSRTRHLSMRIQAARAVRSSTASAPHYASGGTSPAPEGKGVRWNPSGSWPPPDRDERLEDAGATAFRALAGFGQAVGVEDEAALLAASRLHVDFFSGRTRGPDRVPKVLFHVLPAKAEFAGER